MTVEELTDRQLPHNLEAEQGVLGGLLLAPERFDAIEGRLAEDDFFSRAHGAVFGAMVELRRRGQPIDTLMLKEELEKKGRLELAGGAAGLAALINAVPSGAHVEHYAEIVQGKATLRRLIEKATNMITLAIGQEEPVAEILDAAERAIFDVTMQGFSREPESMAQVLKKAWEHIEQSKGDGSLITGLATDYYELDEKLTGFHADELIIVAGRPSIGKSTLALNLVRRIAVDHGHPAVIFSLEMSGENVARNMLSAQAGVDAQKLRTGTFNDEEETTRLVRAADMLSQAPIFIDDTPAVSLAELRGKTRRLKLRHDIKLCVVDYLQLMMPSGKSHGRSREQEISEISRGLKALAKELRITVIALSQLNRRPEDRKDNRPILSDLRESGAIEQDADVVLLLHRTDYYKPEENPGEAEIIIAKQRNGPTGTVNLAFLGHQFRFENLSTRPEAGPEGGGDGFE